MDCKIDGDEIVIRVHIDVLPEAWAQCPYVENNYDPEDEENRPPKIIDAKAFAKDLVRELNSEDEIGTSMVMAMFDDAMERAINNGADGVEGDDED